MRRVMKWLMIFVMALCLLAILAYGAWLKRDVVEVWLGLAEPKPELSSTQADGALCYQSGRG